MRRKISIWIYDDLPIPEKVRAFPVMKHPLHEMLKQLEINQCFDWPMELKATPNQLQAVMRTHEKSTGKRFKFRTIHPRPWKGEIVRYRIWRTQ